MPCIVSDPGERCQRSASLPGMLHWGLSFTRLANAHATALYPGVLPSAAVSAPPPLVAGEASTGLSAPLGAAAGTGACHQRAGDLGACGFRGRDGGHRTAGTAAAGALPEPSY